MSVLLTAEKFRARTHTYVLPPVNVIVSRLGIDTTADDVPVLVFTTAAVRLDTGAALADARLTRIAVDDQKDGPTWHDRLARDLIDDLCRHAAEADRAVVEKATAALRMSSYRRPSDPDHPGRAVYLLGLFTLHLDDLGLHPDRGAGRHSVRRWRLTLHRDGLPLGQPRAWDMADPERDADQVAWFALGRAADPGATHATEVAAALAPLTLATYRH